MAHQRHLHVGHKLGKFTEPKRFKTGVPQEILIDLNPQEQRCFTRQTHQEEETSGAHTGQENLNRGIEKASRAEVESKVGAWCGMGPHYTELWGKSKDVTVIQRTMEDS